MDEEPERISFRALHPLPADILGVTPDGKRCIPSSYCILGVFLAGGQA